MKCVLVLCVAWSTSSTEVDGLSFGPWERHLVLFFLPRSPPPQSVGGVQKHLALMPCAFKWTPIDWGCEFIFFAWYLSQEEGRWSVRASRQTHGVHGRLTHGVHGRLVGSQQTLSTYVRPGGERRGGGGGVDIWKYAYANMWNWALARPPKCLHEGFICKNW